MVESQRGLEYWGVLGLEPGADAAALKRAFREQARRWHPDLNGSDPVAEERFKTVNEAYAVLSDPGKRRAWEEGLAAGGVAGNDDPFASGFPDFEVYLDRLFGRVPAGEEPDDSMPYRPDRAPATAPQTDPGEDRWNAASPAVGRGDVATTPPPPPPPVVAASDEETVLNLTPAQALEGSRVELELADGLVVEVTTPPLAGDGWRLRLAGVTAGGGDHFLQLRVRTEEGLRIDGLRVLYPLELAPADAVLGCQVVVPTLEGAVRLRVPAGSSSGRLLRLRGRGLRDGERRGDQLVEVRIVVPTDLDEAEQALYRRLQQLAQERHDDQAAAEQ